MIFLNDAQLEAPSRCVRFSPSQTDQPIWMGVCRIDIIMIEHEKRKKKNNPTHTTVPAFDAIRGHRSACITCQKKADLEENRERRGKRTHSLATGPVMAEPFISPLGLTITLALSYASKVEFREIWWLQKGTNLEIEEDTISPAPQFALTNYDSRHSYEKRDVSDEISKSYISPILLPLDSKISMFPSLKLQTRNPRASENKIWGLTLFPQLRLSLLHRSDNHVANTSIGQPVEAGTETKGFNYVSDLAPLLSAQLMIAPTGRPRVKRNFVPEAPPP